jgi:hypothetical protein
VLALHLTHQQVTYYTGNNNNNNKNVIYGYYYCLVNNSFFGRQQWPLEIYISTETFEKMVWVVGLLAFESVCRIFQLFY